MIGQQAQAKDYYKILGVAEDASVDAIRKAYRRLARKFHPDVSKEPNAETKFKEVNEAHDVLRDEQKRQAYDQIRQGGFDPSMFGGATGPAGFDLGGDALKDLFETIFGGSFSGFGSGAGQRQHFAEPGRTIEAELAVSLEVAYRGGLQRISVGGRSLEVKVPAGVISGKKIRLKGQGGPGSNGGPAGDLILMLKVQPHHRFELDGRDLSLRLPIAPWEAAQGAKVTVATLDGSVELKIPSGARSGQRLRLKGRGMPGKSPGDLMVQLMIQTPPADSDELETLYRRLAEVSQFDPRQ